MKISPEAMAALIFLGLITCSIVAVREASTEKCTAKVIESLHAGGHLQRLLNDAMADATKEIDDAAMCKLDPKQCNTEEK